MLLPIPRPERALVLHENVPRSHVYRRPPAPVTFPEAEEVPETNHHLELRTALYLLLKREIGTVATIGSDQFVYWDPTTARKRLAPDVFVRVGTPHKPFRSWKIWERGAPELGVEIISDSDEPEPDWNEKLERYRSAGVKEVVRFHPDDPARPIRIWDAVGGDLVERDDGDPALHACETLGLWWVVVDDPALGATLRLARDREGRDLLLTPDEAEAKARDGEAKARDGEAKARDGEAKARDGEAKARDGEAKARDGEAKAREAAAQLERENEALRAALKKAKAGPTRARKPRAPR